MAKLSMIWVWPGMGFAEGFWSGIDPENADENAFYRTSMRVCEIFSEELAKEGIEARSSEVRFFGELGDGPDLTVQAIEGIKDGFEMVRLSIPSGVHRLLPQQRAELVASAVEVAMDRFAQLNGWDRSKIKDAMARARETSFERSWLSEWKSSKDRKWRVRLVGQLLDDGYVRLRVEQASTENGSTVLSNPIRGGTSRKSFLRAAKSMRWDDERALTFDNGARFSSTTSGRLFVPSETLQSDPDLPEPRQNNMGEGVAAIPAVRLLAPNFRWFGGAGPLENGTEHYYAEVRSIEEVATDDPLWRDWWTGVGLTEVYTPVWFTGVGFKTLIRQTDTRLTAIRYRAADSIPENEAAARDLARSDFSVLIQRVQARFKLPDPPSLI